jgi:hypothetical protein
MSDIIIRITEEVALTRNQVGRCGICCKETDLKRGAMSRRNCEIKLCPQCGLNEATEDLFNFVEDKEFPESNNNLKEMLDSGQLPDYLGDGLYVNFDGYAINLMCEREENGEIVVHYVALDPYVRKSFLNYIKRLDEHIESVLAGKTTKEQSKNEEKE